MPRELGGLGPGLRAAATAHATMAAGTRGFDSMCMVGAVGLWLMTLSKVQRYVEGLI